MIQIKAGLTKETFFDKLKEKFPKAMEHFCKWIDEYKEAIGWNNLFNEGYETISNNIDDDWITKAPKFHELPYDFQVGIWIAYLQTFPDTFDRYTSYMSLLKGELAYSMQIYFNWEEHNCLK